MTAATKTCILIQGQYGQYLFDGDELITYIHNGDGYWDQGNYDPVLEYYGVKVSFEDTPTEAQRAKMFDEDDDG